MIDGASGCAIGWIELRGGCLLSCYDRGLWERVYGGRLLVEVMVGSWMVVSLGEGDWVRGLCVYLRVFGSKRY